MYASSWSKSAAYYGCMRRKNEGSTCCGLEAAAVDDLVTQQVLHLRARHSGAEPESDPVLARGSSGIFSRGFARGFLGQVWSFLTGRRTMLAWGAGGGNEHPCSTARCRRNSRQDGRLMPLPPTTFPAARMQRGPSPANAGSRLIDCPHKPQGAPGGHLLHRVTKPSGDAGCYSERETRPGTRGRAGDSHIISSRPPRFSEFDEIAPRAPIAGASGTEFARGCMVRARTPQTFEQ